MVADYAIITCVHNYVYSKVNRLLARCGALRISLIFYLYSDNEILEIAADDKKLYNSKIISPDLETGSHDHKNSIDNSSIELSDNELSYQRLLDKEEAEDTEMDMIPMDDLVAYKIDKNLELKYVNPSVISQFKTKLLDSKEQAMHSCKTLVSLLR